MWPSDAPSPAVKRRGARAPALWLRLTNPWLAEIPTSHRTCAPSRLTACSGGSGVSASTSAVRRSSSPSPCSCGASGAPRTQTAWLALLERNPCTSTTQKRNASGLP
eukprot:scaffold107269_cov57-Phaeocystis_antarctica.AAC.2